MKRPPHTSTNPGKRVRIVRRDGTTLEGKFVESRSRSVVLDTGTVRRRDLDKFIVVKR